MATVTLVIPCESSDGTVTGVQCPAGVTSVTVQATYDDTYTMDVTTATEIFSGFLAVPMVLWVMGRSIRELFRLFER